MSVTSLHDWRIDAMSPAEREAVAARELRALRAALAEDEARREAARAPPYPGQKARVWEEAEAAGRALAKGLCVIADCPRMRVAGHVKCAMHLVTGGRAP